MPQQHDLFPFALAGAQARDHAVRCRAELALLPDDPSHERLRLTANLAAALVEIDPEQASHFAALARELADQLGTQTATAYALVVAGLTDHSPDTVGTRVSAARRILSIAAQGTTPELAHVGHFLLLTALLERGQLRMLDIELSPHGESITRFPDLQHSRHAQWFRCLRAILDGRTEEAERLANTILEASDPQHLDASGSIWAAQIGTIRWMQGRIDEMEPAFLAARQAYPQQLMWEISLAWLWQAQGRSDAAMALFENFSDLDTIPRDRNYLVTLVILAELAAKVGTVEQGEMLREALLPYATQGVPVGLGLAFWGTVARTLGTLTLRLGREDEARSLLRTAIEVCARNGAQAWLVEAQLELADLEVSTGGDVDAARELALQAQRTSRTLGFAALLARAEQTLGRIGVAPVADSSGAAAETDAVERTAVFAAGPEISIVDEPVAGRASPAPGAGGSAVGSRMDDSGASAITRGGIASTECPRARVRVLGVFEVTSHAGVAARWSSRKARELLKMLVARRGVATAREVFMQELWPDTNPDALSNRFAVALSTIRRAFDPPRALPPRHFIVSDGVTLHLNLANLDIDLEAFLAAARETDVSSLRTATELYLGDAFADEPYAEWAEAPRREAQVAFCVAAHALAAHESAAGDELAASQLYQRILDVEPFDLAAHDGLIASLRALGTQTQAEAVAERRRRLHAELTA